MDEAIALLTEWLTIIPSRTTFTADEVSDLIVDLHSCLTRPVPVTV